jgi:hypothetical protein
MQNKDVQILKSRPEVFIFKNASLFVLTSGIYTGHIDANYHKIFCKEL